MTQLVKAGVRCPTTRREVRLKVAQVAAAASATRSPDPSDRAARCAGSPRVMTVAAPTSATRTPARRRRSRRSPTSGEKRSVSTGFSAIRSAVLVALVRERARRKSHG